MATCLVFHLSLVVISLFGLGDCQSCAMVTNQYYTCLYNNATEEFYQSKLGNISNVDGAMESIKKIYGLLNNCKLNQNYNSTLCACLADSVDYIKVVQWDLVFLNTTNFNTLKQYITEEHQNLTIYNYTADALTTFCRQYEWHFTGFFNYQESSCIYSNTWKPNTGVAVKKRAAKFSSSPSTNVIDTQYLFQQLTQMSDCFALYITSNYANYTGFLSVDLQDYDKFLKCVYLSYNVSCSPLLKRKFLLEAVLILPGLFNTSSLSAYINSVMNSETKAVIKRYDTYLVGDPHVLVYKANESVTCNLIDEICLANDHMQIRCYAKNFTSTSKVTVLTAVKITFHIDGNNYEYIANSTSFPNTLTNGNSVIKDNANKTVVKVYSAFNGVYLYDLTTLTHIYLDSWGMDIYYLLVRGTDSFYTSSTGILVQGCPSHLVNSYKRKRDAQSVYEETCNTTAYSKENIFVAPSDVLKTCTFDCQTAQDVSYAQMYNEFITSMKNLRITDIDVQPSTGASGSNALSVFFINYNIIFLSVITTTLFVKFQF